MIEGFVVSVVFITPSEIVTHSTCKMSPTHVISQLVLSKEPFAFAKLALRMCVDRGLERYITFPFVSFEIIHAVHVLFAYK